LNRLVLLNDSIYEVGVNGLTK